MPVWDDRAARSALRSIFDAAVAAADPRLTLAAHLPEKPKGRCIVVGAGKASALMAAALELAWPDVELSGLVVTRYGHAVPTARVEVMEAGHPVPDHNSEVAARRIIAMVAGLTEDDLVLALMSGGGSALLTLPAEGITLADKQAINRGLLLSGTQIHEMNAVRKHLSAIKGGRLALAARPATVVTLAMSDVPGDDIGVIASGPTIPDGTTLQEVDDILRTSGIVIPASVARHLASHRETPKPGDFPVDARLIATPMNSLRAAASTAQALGLTPLILGDALEGESHVVGQVMAGIALSIARHGEPLARPAVILSGGETTVTLGHGPHGRGGRNMEFLLALALALGSAPGIWALAGDSDGIDGMEAAAGAIVTPDTLLRARAARFDPATALRSHDSFSLFAQLSDLVVTGPTLTNVNDVRAVLIA